MTTFSQQVYSPAQREPIYRRNFLLFVTDSIFYNVAMGFIGMSTVIPDFIGHLTDSKILIGLSGSIFNIGWALPQLFIARSILRHERKKLWFVGPNIPVRLIILVFGILVTLLGEERTGTILTMFFVCYGLASLGDGLVSVPWWDLCGNSLDARWRARLFGLGSAITGVIMLGISPLIGVILGENGPAFPNNYALLFIAAGTLFGLSILPGVFVHELPGGKALDKTPTIREFIPQLGRVLRTDRPFRAMLIARLLTVLLAMAAPFYVGFATQRLGLTSAVAVPTLVAMQTIGSLGGALLYTWLGARHNLVYIRLALVGGLCLPVSALVAPVAGPWLLYLGYLVSGLALSNLWFAFANWVVTYTTPDQRPIYAGLFNTGMAVVALIAPFVAGTLAQQLGYEALFVVAFAMGLAALFVTVRYVTS